MGYPGHTGFKWSSTTLLTAQQVIGEHEISLRFKYSGQLFAQVFWNVINEEIPSLKERAFVSVRVDSRSRKRRITTRGTLKVTRGTP